MLEKEFTYIHKEKEYLVKVKRKRMKSIRYTFKDGVFHVSAPYFFASKKDILNGLDKFAEKLIEGDKRGKASGDNYFYLLGEKKEIGESGELLINNECILIYKDKDDLEKKLRKWFSLFTNRNRFLRPHRRFLLGSPVLFPLIVASKSNGPDFFTIVLFDIELFTFENYVSF